MTESQINTVNQLDEEHLTASSAFPQGYTNSGY